MVIYAIPGLGTTKKLYVNTKIKGVEIIVLDWPTPEKNDTMQSYARKFLPQINTNVPFCLLGVSFGGMLCTELSKIISPQKTFLISSCKSRKELPWFIKTLKYISLHKIVSEKQHRKMAYQGRWIIGFGKAYIPEFLGMVNSMTQNYFKYCIHIIVNWDRTEFPENVVHIHGNTDRLLWYKYVKADYTIHNGSHAMIVFQAEEINKIIEKELNLS
ncbi:MAG: hypothetical protein C0448_08835 [Sphingobacteriaceae bacterium]|nr:hypothetical protein [Sphingobacteriaceae bacterium]